MRKGLIFLGIMVMILSFISMGGYTIAGPAGSAKCQLNWGEELNSEQCPDGELVINVTHKAINGLDSGVKDWWAFVDCNRHIQVWQVASDTFCAVVQYKGKFVTLAGDSPGGTDTINAGIEGTFHGGYRMTITGILKTDPVYPTKGNIGTFDYECEAINYPSHVNACNNLWIWQDEYFESGYGKSHEWWGWIYRGGKNGTWVNLDPAAGGNCGDITD